MAGDDHKMDLKIDIEKYVERNIRELFTMEMNEYQDSAWVQATELFDEVVIPSK